MYLYIYIYIYVYTCLLYCMRVYYMLYYIVGDNGLSFASVYSFRPALFYSSIV